VSAVARVPARDPELDGDQNDDGEHGENDRQMETQARPVRQLHDIHDLPRAENNGGKREPTGRHQPSGIDQKQPDHAHAECERPNMVECRENPEQPAGKRQLPGRVDGGWKGRNHQACARKKQEACRPFATPQRPYPRPDPETRQPHADLHPEGRWQRGDRALALGRD
jgi:hypothetical protein